MKLHDMFLWILPGIKSQFWFPFTFRLFLEDLMPGSSKKHPHYCCKCYFLCTDHTKSKRHCSLLQWCTKLGKRKVMMFFKDITEQLFQVRLGTKSWTFIRLWERSKSYFAISFNACDSSVNWVAYNEYETEKSVKLQYVIWHLRETCQIKLKEECREAFALSMGYRYSAV